jgi:hypothetical protein
VATICGFFIYIEFVSKLALNESIDLLKNGNLLGKVLTLGAIPNLFVFMIFIKKKQDNRAKGVLIATILIAFTTLILKLL